MTWLTEANTCPGIFYGTRAQDGYLLRIRVPGGILSVEQAQVFLEFLAAIGCDRCQITNRGNLQVRGVQQPPQLQDFEKLQSVGLAAINPHIDHLRNVMGSPTAGIDPAELIDTRPLIQQIDDYLQQQPQYADLSAKFSIGIDGGGSVGIGTRSPIAWEHRLNDIQLTAILENNQQVSFALQLAGNQKLHNTGWLINPEHVVEAIAALTDVYHQYSQEQKVNYALKTTTRKPRLRSLIQNWGIDQYLNQVRNQLSFSPKTDSLLLPLSQPYQQFGCQPQKQPELFYLGIRPFLGQVSYQEISELIDQAQVWGCSELRLTPWQTIILPNLTAAVAQEAESAIANLHFMTRATDPVIVACAGQPVCASAVAPTDQLARNLAAALKTEIDFDNPVNIHISGCSKFCAQSSPAEITVLALESSGESLDQKQYDVNFGDSTHFDRLTIPKLDKEQVIASIVHILKHYQRQSQQTSESLIEFLLRSPNHLSPESTAATFA